MRKTDNEILIERLRDYEKRCDGFLQDLQSIEILNLNLEMPSEAVIDPSSSEWKIFYDDYFATSKRGFSFCVDHTFDDAEKNPPQRPDRRCGGFAFVQW